MSKPAPKHPAANAIVRIGTVASIPAVLRELGASPESVLGKAGIEPALFENPDNVISYKARGRLLRVCVEQTKCPHFGLLVGQKAGIESLGLPGLLAKYSPDVETALCNLVGAMHLHVRGATVDFSVDTRTAILRYDVHEPDAEASNQIGDGAVAIMHNVMLSLCGANWKPIEIWLAHRQPENLRPFRKAFNAPLLFNKKSNAIVFSRTYLRQRLPNADVELQRLLRQQIDMLEAKFSEEFPEQVRRVLRAALLTGHTSADMIAAIFSIHPRTLSRRLEEYGMNFRVMVDEERFGISRQMLRDTELAISDIASALDYADASAFTRAFRRWSGTTPAAWRARPHG